MMGRRPMEPLRAAAAALAAVLLAGCPALMLEKKGNVRIAIVADDSGATGPRTILPTLDARTFRVSFSGPASIAPVEADAQDSFELGPGRWTARAEGLNAAGQVVAAGESGPFEVVLGASVSVSILLTRLGTGNGRIDLSLSWPATLDPPVASATVKYAPVNEQTAQFDPTALVEAAAGSVETSQEGNQDRLRWRQELPAGSYAVQIEFDRGPGLGKIYYESAQIGGNAVSAHEEDLLQEFFTEMPEAPAALSALSVPGGIRLSWTDASRVETGYSVYRRPSGATDWTRLTRLPTTGGDGPARAFLDDQGLAVGSSYDYRVSGYVGSGASPTDSPYAAETSGRKEASAGITIEGPSDLPLTILADGIPVGSDGRGFPRASRIALSILEYYPSYEWRLGRSLLGGAQSLEVDLAAFDAGVYHLSVSAERDGWRYSRRARIVIEN